MNSLSRGFVVTLATVGALALAGVAYAMHFTSWAPPRRSTRSPGTAPRSTRRRSTGAPPVPGRAQPVHGVEPPAFRGGHGPLDIWVAHRATTDVRWERRRTSASPSTRLPTTSAPRRSGDGLFFVSRRLAGSCGLGDIYFARPTRLHGWREPSTSPALRPARTAPSTSRVRPTSRSAGPSPVLLERSALRPVRPRRDLRERNGRRRRSVRRLPSTGLNDPAAANDIQPNVRKDGLEVVFSLESGRHAGAQDIWVAYAESIHDPGRRRTTSAPP